MANDLVNTQPGRKGTNPWVVVLFLLVAIGGAAYLGFQDIDWMEKLASLTQPPVQPPAAQAPAPASIMAPSFDAVSADGGMLVAAGKAQPGATILLQSGGQTLGEAKAPPVLNGLIANVPFDLCRGDELRETRQGPVLLKVAGS